MQILKSRRYNIEAVIKIVILLGFALFFLITIVTGKTQLYVHPRIIPYIVFDVVAMILIAGFIFADIFKPQRTKSSLVPYLCFIVPLFLAFSLPAKSMDSSYLVGNDIRIGSQSINSSPNDISRNNLPENNSSGGLANNSSSNSASPSISVDSNSDSYLSKKNTEVPENNLKLQEETIIIDDNNFVQWTVEIYEHMDKYEGKKVQLIGFVLRDPRMKPNEFVPARFMMSCCTADMQPIGLLCQYPKASELKKDSWVQVTGTIKETTFEGQNIPLFKADSVVGVEKPKHDYVYPY
jgi:putative membrane protein